MKLKELTAADMSKILFNIDKGKGFEIGEYEELDTKNRMRYLAEGQAYLNETLEDWPNELVEEVKRLSEMEKIQQDQANV